MSSNFPRRPPRRPGGGERGRSGSGSGGGRAAPEDTSSTGLLVNVVRTLTTSQSTEQRDFERQKLENGYSETGKNIDGLIGAHQSDLTSSLQTFRKVSTRITATRERVRNVKNSVSACKALLQCKRDELQKLWVENAEQKYVASLLEQVEEIRKVPESAKEAAEKKHYLKSAELLLNARECCGALMKGGVGQGIVSVVSLEGDLIVVDGLRDMKEEIRRRNEKIFESILEEVDKMLYLKPTEELIRDLQAGRVGSELSLHSQSCLSADEKDFPVLQDNGCAFEDPEDTSPENSPVQYLAVLSEALGVLRRIPDGLENIKHRIQRGLTRMVQNTTLAYYESALAGLGEEGGRRGVGDGRNLGEVLHLLFRQFKAVGVLHHLLLSQLHRVAETRHVERAAFYEMSDVWAQIQVALQQFLSDYLDVRRVEGLGQASHTPSNAPPPLSSFFTKRKPIKPSKRPTLFRFEATSQALTVSDFAKGQRSEAAQLVLSLAPRFEKSERIWICPPSPSNVTVVFKPLMKFAGEIESKCGTEISGLRQFLDNHVKTTFWEKAHADIKHKADAALLSPDAWQTVVGAEEQRRLEAPVPVLSSSAKSLDLCKLVESYMQALPSFASNLAALWLLVLGEYNNCVQKVYDEATRSRSAGEGLEGGGQKISAVWTDDQDISRLLKSLPNWMTLVQATVTVPNTPFSPPTAPATPMVESADEIKSRNQKESDILTSNVGSEGKKEIQEWEIIKNLNHIRSLANIHESLEWFCGVVRRLLGGLPPAIQEKLANDEVEIKKEGTDQPPIREPLSLGFQRNLEALEEMAGRCILMLHLEVRVHCFYHLLPLRKVSHTISARDSQEPERSVLAVNRDLVQLHDLLASQLQPRKVRYVFEGLGHLIAEIFIHSPVSIQKINENGKKRMCRNIFAIQQCLSGLTGSREPDLDVARKFFELLSKSPDDILNDIVDRGPEYGELEYRCLVGLAIRSHPVLSSEPGVFEDRMLRLRNIMAERKK